MWRTRHKHQHTSTQRDLKPKHKLDFQKLYTEKKNNGLAVLKQYHENPYYALNRLITGKGKDNFLSTLSFVTQMALSIS